MNAVFDLEATLSKLQHEGANFFNAAFESTMEFLKSHKNKGYIRKMSFFKTFRLQMKE